MGYTRYWQRTEKPYDEAFVEEVKAILAECQTLGISIKNGFGEGDPQVDLTMIWFNGDEALGTDHETFALLNPTCEYFKLGFDCCKTYEKPYDYAVRKILRLAESAGYVTSVRDDGESEQILSDKDWLEQEKKGWW